MTYYLIGISGIGMSALALILKDLGFNVLGSTKEKNYICEILEKEGIKIFYGHKKENIRDDYDFVVYSSAIKKDHIERIAAKEKGIEELHRSDLLKDIINLHKKNILITGTHGKTTTTSLISYIFFKAKKNFSSYIGGIVNFLKNKNGKLDKSFSTIICEADESDKSFLKYSPFHSVITNIDKDHLDFYKDEEDIKRTFLNFINSTNSMGKIFLTLENSIFDLNFLKNIKRNFVLILPKEKYERNLKFLENLKYLDYVLSYEKKNEIVYVYKNKRAIFSFTPSLPGEHNILNSLLAVGVSLEYKIKKEIIKQALETFKNAKRRLEIIYEDKEKGLLVLDDYAHHPKELEAVILSLKELYPEKNIFLIFQPHRYSRFYKLEDEFLKVFKKYKKHINILLTDIYPAGEKNIYGLDIKNICKKENLKYIKSIDEIPLKENSVYITVGAGDIYTWAYKLKERLK